MKNKSFDLRFSRTTSFDYSFEVRDSKTIFENKILFLCKFVRDSNTTFENKILCYVYV